MSASTRSLFCPACRAPLPWPAGDEVRCSACQHTVPVRDGIPLLGASHDYYYAEIPLDAMEWFLERARAGRPADVFEQPAYEGPWAFLLGSHFDPTRGAWKYATRLPERRYERVLDFGCGWGVNSFALAPDADEVVAMDLSWHRLVNMRLLAEARGLANVTVLCGGDVQPLPFPDDHFDLVAMIGLIEWIPVGQPGNPRRLQREFLREIRRVTRPGGEIFLASENRYAYSYWVGKPDDHTGLLFGSLLPRPLAHLYSRLVRGRKYEHYTYSRRQYRRLLRSAGFGHTEVHGLIPAHRLFHKMYPLSRGRVVDREETRGTGLKDRLLKTRAAAGMAGAFGIRGGGAPLAQSYLRRLCRRLGELPEFRDLEPEPYRLITSNFSVKASVRSRRGGGALVRIPLSGHKTALLANARQAQSGWRDRGAPGPFILPVARAMEFEGQTLTAETLAAGRPGRPARGARAHGQVAAVLESFAGTRGRGAVRDHVLALRAEGGLAGHLGAAHQPVLDRLAGSARLAQLSTCFQHGDFHWENLLTTDGALAAIVDWDWARGDGIPLADVFHLTVNDGGVAFGPATVARLEAAATGSFPRSELAQVAGHLQTVHGLVADDLPVLAVVYAYDVLRQQYEAAQSFAFGQPFLPEAIRRVADALPPVASRLLDAG